MGKRQRSQQPDVSQMVDMHLRWGLEDDIIRIPRKAFGVLLETLVLQAEDVVLRCVYPNMERNIILRGTENASMEAKPADPSKNIPVYNLVLVSEWRARILEEQGHGKGQ